MKSINNWFCLLILLGSCSVNDYPDSNVFRGKALSIRYKGEVKNNDWIKLDDILFVHRTDFDPDNAGGTVRDSINDDGEKVKYYPLPASVRYFKLGKQWRTENIVSTVMLAELVEHLSEINQVSHKYQMNLGANLWLNNTLEIFSEQEIVIVTNADIEVVPVTTR